MRLISHIAILLLFGVFAPVSFALHVELTSEVDDGLEENIHAHLSILTLPERCVPFTDFSDQIAEKIHEAGRALGYYDMRIRALEPKSDTQCNTWTLNIEQGQRTRISRVDIHIEGEGSQDPVLQRTLNQIPLKQGDALRHYIYESSKKALLNTALERGYMDFAFTEKRLEIDPDSHTAQIKLHANTGESYRFGKLVYDGQDVPEDMLMSILPFREGEQFTTPKLNTFNERLRQTGYFEHVVARPVRAKAQARHIPIEVVGSVKPRDIFSVGGGVSSDTGPRVKLSWERPWITDSGHSLSASLFVSRPSQSVSLNYKIPLSDPIDDYISVKTGLKQDNFNDTDSTIYTVSLQHHERFLDTSWKWVKFIRFDRESFIQAEEPEETTELLIPGVTFQRLRTRGGLFVTWGDKQLLTVEGANDDLLSEVDYASVHLQSKWIRSIHDHRFHFNVELGALSSSDFEQIPSSLRFFAGGDQSVRGFGYKELSPLDDEGDLTGGRFLYVGSIEYDFPVKDNWRVATFADVGNASNTAFESLASGVGVGAIWQSPVGPVRLYLARGNSQHETTWRIHFSMGPAL
ncbi:autotransporter assembly complex protein TamA [Aestuariibacter sp. AA17]|uniref:Translocation and assembly module subunit TamA n=1 Tax=Fluctibacter corallii TaxID=2984329 RepID=A0ABT3A607_9ALTE|nr:autotransporter assembly complex family protein [Aestuariibacter sp. AA17]MCV2884110.1 autotransporter assembly complex protein TamA [Aestuariibacter sp. AA17]